MDNRVHHASDQLTHRAFTFRATWFAVEILTGNNVRRGLRPVLWHVDIFLAEDGDALFVADQSSALFPFDGVERSLLSVGEEAFKHQSASRTHLLGRFRSH